MNIRPKEIKTFKYWFHLFIDLLIIGILLNLFVEPMALDFRYFLLGLLFLGIAEVISHTTLGLD